MARDARELHGAWATFQRHWYGVPSAELASYVSGYWAAEWDLRGQAPYRQKIVPYPNVQLTLRDGAAVVRGPERGHVVRVLEGRGRVFGVTFRPGCFRPFLGASVSTLTGRALPAAAVFGPGLPPAPPVGPAPRDPTAPAESGEVPAGGSGEAAGEAAGESGEAAGESGEAAGDSGEAAASDSGEVPASDSGEVPAGGQPASGCLLARAFEDSAQATADAVEAFLRVRLPPSDPLAEQAAAVVARVRAEPGITRVDALAERSGLGVRRLQRLFAGYVGLGPKWVIRRYRLHEVGERLAAGAEIDWVRLAGELGYADQAHFIRDFTAMVGESPTRYAARYPGPGQRDGRH